jgi:hypothetical protein
MSGIKVGDRVFLRYAPYRRAGVVTALVHGNARVRWGDLELTTRHAPEALLLAGDEWPVENKSQLEKESA